MAGASDEDTLHHSGDDGHNGQPDGGEKGKKPEDKPPTGFWCSELKECRNWVFKQWALTTVILSVAILCVLSLYWGVLFHVESNLSALVVYIVDFDGQSPYNNVTPMIGPQIVAAAETLIAPSGSLGWGSLPASAFNNDPIAVRQAVYDQKAWAAIIINANATSAYQNAIENGDVNYDPLGIAQVIYVEARDQMNYQNYIVPQLNQFQTMAASKVGGMMAGQALQRAIQNPTVLANIAAAPQIISPGIGFSIFNLRPFSPAVATPAVTIGLLYLIIFSFFSFTFYLPVHMKFIKSPGHPPLHYYQLVIWRYLATIVSYFFLSLFYSLVSLAFQIPFSTGTRSEVEVFNPATAYGKGSFVVYWMLNFVGMGALGLACENTAMVLGQPWTAFWLIFWVITNVSTSFYSIDLAPHFYYWGYAWPVHNLVEASRTILFDVHSRIGLNFGVLFAWTAVNTVLFPFCCWFMRWKMKKGLE